MLIKHYPCHTDSTHNLVLLHGWAMHSGIWESVQDKLLDKLHLWCVDFPGHGQAINSTWPDQPLSLVDHIARQVPTDSIWLGWSMGGLFALQAATQQYCNRLVLVASNPCFIKHPHWPDAMPVSVFQSFADGLETGFDKTLNRFLALAVFGSEHAKAQLQQLQHIAFTDGKPSATALRGGLTLLQQADFSTGLPALNLPTLLIGGCRDRLVPWTCLEQATNKLADATLVRIPGAGHAPFIGNPDAFTKALLAFCDGI